MRLIDWILVLPATATAVLFAVSNRQQTEVQLWPLPYVIDLPIYIVGLVPLVIGFLIGALTMWYCGIRRRIRRRIREKETLNKLPKQQTNPRT